MATANDPAPADLGYRREDWASLVAISQSLCHKTDYIFHKFHQEAAAKRGVFNESERNTSNEKDPLSLYELDKITQTLAINPSRDERDKVRRRCNEGLSALADSAKTLQDGVFDRRVRVLDWLSSSLRRSDLKAPNKLITSLTSALDEDAVNLPGPRMWPNICGRHPEMWADSPENLEAFLDKIIHMDPLSLRYEPIDIASFTNHVEDFAKNTLAFARNHPPDDDVLASKWENLLMSVAGLLGLGVTTASPFVILTVIDLLCQISDIFPEKIVTMPACRRLLQMIEKLIKYGHPEGLTVPVNAAKVRQWTYHHHFPVSCNAFATDGGYVYVHNEWGLLKLGTGHAGTISGHVYATNDEYHVKNNSERIWLAFASGSLYCRTSSMSPSQIDQVSVDDLKVIQTLELGSNAATAPRTPSGSMCPLLSDGKLLHIVSYVDKSSNGSSGSADTLPFADLSKRNEYTKTKRRRRKSKPSRSDAMQLEVGMRVMRGPDWKWGDQDGGAGHLGTVVKVGGWGAGGKVGTGISVKWDVSGSNTYRWGVPSKDGRQCYDLTFVSHAADTAEKEASQVTDPRATMRSGVRVIRGPDWKWGDQDGEPGGLGTVERIGSWGGIEKVGVTVRWDKHDRTNTYRWGAEDCYDLIIVEEKDGKVAERFALPAKSKREKEISRYAFVLYTYDPDQIAPYNGEDDDDEDPDEEPAGPSADLQRMTTIHPHPLEISSHTSPWLCDGSLPGCTHGDSLPRMRCSMCDFDLCQPCFKSSLVVKPKKQLDPPSLVRQKGKTAEKASAMDIDAGIFGDDIGSSLGTPTPNITLKEDDVGSGEEHKKATESKSTADLEVQTEDLGGETKSAELEIAGDKMAVPPEAAGAGMDVDDRDAGEAAESGVLGPSRTLIFGADQEDQEILIDALQFVDGDNKWIFAGSLEDLAVNAISGLKLSKDALAFLSRAKLVGAAKGPRHQAEKLLAKSFGTSRSLGAIRQALRLSEYDIDRAAECLLQGVEEEKSKFMLPLVGVTHLRTQDEEPVLEPGLLANSTFYCTGKQICTIVPAGSFTSFTRPSKHAGKTHCVRCFSLPDGLFCGEYPLFADSNVQPGSPATYDQANNLLWVYSMQEKSFELYSNVGPHSSLKLSATPDHILTTYRASSCLDAQQPSDSPKPQNVVAEGSSESNAQHEEAEAVMSRQSIVSHGSEATEGSIQGPRDSLDTAEATSQETGEDNRVNKLEQQMVVQPAPPYLEISGAFASIAVSSEAVRKLTCKASGFVERIIKCSDTSSDALQAQDEYEEASAALLPSDLAVILIANSSRLVHQRALLPAEPSLLVSLRQITEQLTEQWKQASGVKRKSVPIKRKLNAMKHRLQETVRLSPNGTTGSQIPFSIEVSRPMFKLLFDLLERYSRGFVRGSSPPKELSAQTEREDFFFLFLLRALAAHLAEMFNEGTNLDQVLRLCNDDQLNKQVGCLEAILLSLALSGEVENLEVVNSAEDVLFLGLESGLFFREKSEKVKFIEAVLSRFSQSLPAEASKKEKDRNGPISRICFWLAEKLHILLEAFLPEDISDADKAWRLLEQLLTNVRLEALQDLRSTPASDQPKSEQSALEYKPRPPSVSPLVKLFAAIQAMIITAIDMASPSTPSSMKEVFLRYAEMVLKQATAFLQELLSTQSSLGRSYECISPLEGSFVWVLIPPLMASLRFWVDKMYLSEGENPIVYAQRLVPSLLSLVQVVDQINRRVPSITALDQRYLYMLLGSIQTSEVVVESSHPYSRGQPLLKEVVHFPGALALSVTFDTRSHTVSEADQLQIYYGSMQADRPPEKVFWGNQRTDEKSTDSATSELSRWPAHTLVIPGDTATFVFTASSHAQEGRDKTRWGFKCTIKGVRYESLPSLLDLEQGIIDVCVRISSALVAGPIISLAEAKCGRWLRSDLLSGGVQPLQLSPAPKVGTATHVPDKEEAQRKFLEQVLEEESEVGTGLAAFLKDNSRIRLPQSLPEECRRLWSRTFSVSVLALVKHSGLLQEVMQHARRLFRSIGSPDSKAHPQVQHLRTRLTQIVHKADDILRWMLRRLQLEREWSDLLHEVEGKVTMDLLSDRYGGGNHEALQEICALKAITFNSAELGETLRSVLTALETEKSSGSRSRHFQDDIATEVLARAELLLQFRVSERSYWVFSSGKIGQQLESSDTPDTLSPFDDDTPPALNLERAFSTKSAGKGSWDKTSKKGLAVPSLGRSVSYQPQQMGKPQRKNSESFLDSRVDGLRSWLESYQRWKRWQQTLPGEVDPTQRRSPILAVIAFLKSPTKPADILESVEKHETRALLRCAGMTLQSDLLQAVGFGGLKQQLLGRICGSLSRPLQMLSCNVGENTFDNIVGQRRHTKPPVLHYNSNVNLCGTLLAKTLTARYAKVGELLSGLLSNEQEHVMNRFITAIDTVGIDYSEEDSELLSSLNLFKSVLSLLPLTETDSFTATFDRSKLYPIADAVDESLVELTESFWAIFGVLFARSLWWSDRKKDESESATSQTHSQALSEVTREERELKKRREAFEDLVLDDVLAETKKLVMRLQNECLTKRTCIVSAVVQDSLSRLLEQLLCHRLAPSVQRGFKKAGWAAMVFQILLNHQRLSPRLQKAAIRLAREIFALIDEASLSELASALLSGGTAESVLERLWPQSVTPRRVEVDEKLSIKQSSAQDVQKGVVAFLISWIGEHHVLASEVFESGLGTDYAVVVHGYEGVSVEQWVSLLEAEGDPSTPAFDTVEAEAKQEQAAKEAAEAAVAAAASGIAHRGVRCDGCNESPLTGPRYKCQTCSDYDLCQTCYTSPIHEGDHPFYRILTPHSSRVSLLPRTQGGGPAPDAAPPGSTLWKVSLVLRHIFLNGFIVYRVTTYDSALELGQRLAAIGLHTTVVPKENLEQLQQLQSINPSVGWSGAVEGAKGIATTIVTSGEAGSGNGSGGDAAPTIQVQAPVVEADPHLINLRNTMIVDSGRAMPTSSVGEVPHFGRLLRHHAAQEIISELIALVRFFLQDERASSTWKVAAKETLQQGFRGLRKAATVKVAAATPEVILAEAFGAVCVAGGFLEPLRVGGRVHVVKLSVLRQGKVLGTVSEFVPGSGDVTVLLDSPIKDSNSGELSSQIKVSPAQLLPVPEYAPAANGLELTAEFLSCFSCFLGSEPENERTATDRSKISSWCKEEVLQHISYSELRWRALKVLATHMPLWAESFLSDNEILTTQSSVVTALIQEARGCSVGISSILGEIESVRDRRSLWEMSRGIVKLLAQRPLPQGDAKIDPLLRDCDDMYTYNLYSYGSFEDLPRDPGRNKLLEYWEKNVIPAIQKYVRGSFKPYEMEYFFAQLREPLREGNSGGAMKIAYTLCDGHVPPGCVYPDPNTDWSALRLDDIEIGQRYMISANPAGVQNWPSAMRWTAGKSGVVRNIDLSFGAVLLQLINEDQGTLQHWWFGVNVLVKPTEYLSQEPSAPVLTQEVSNLYIGNHRVAQLYSRDIVFQLLKANPTLLSLHENSASTMPPSIPLKSLMDMASNVAIMPNLNMRTHSSFIGSSRAQDKTRSNQEMLSIVRRAISTLIRMKQHNSSRHLSTSSSYASASVSPDELTASLSPHSNVPAVKSTSKRKPKHIDPVKEKIKAHTARAGARGGLEHKHREGSAEETESLIEISQTVPTQNTVPFATQLSGYLVSEFEGLLRESAKFTAANICTRKDMNPAAPLSHIKVPHASALVISFHLHPVLMEIAAGSAMCFYADEACTKLLRGYYGGRRGFTTPPPVVVPSQECWLKVTDPANVRYRFTVSPVDSKLGLGLWIAEQLLSGSGSTAQQSTQGTDKPGTAISSESSRSLHSSPSIQTSSALSQSDSKLPRQWVEKPRVVLYRVTAALIEYVLTSNSSTVIKEITFPLIVRSLRLAYDAQADIKALASRLFSLGEEMVYVFEKEQGKLSSYFQQLVELLAVAQEVVSDAPLGESSSSDTASSTVSPLRCKDTSRGPGNTVKTPEWFEDICHLTRLVRSLAGEVTVPLSAEVEGTSGFYGSSCPTAASRKIPTQELSALYSESSKDHAAARYIFVQGLPRTQRIVELKDELHKFVVSESFKALDLELDYESHFAVERVHYGCVGRVVSLPTDEEGYSLGYGVVDVGRADVARHLVKSYDASTGSPFSFDGQTTTLDEMLESVRNNGHEDNEPFAGGEDDKDEDAHADGSQEDGWSCAACTFLNPWSVSTCEICESPCMVENPASLRSQQSSSAPAEVQPAAEEQDVQATPSVEVEGEDGAGTQTHNVSLLSMESLLRYGPASESERLKTVTGDILLKEEAQAHAALRTVYSKYNPSEPTVGQDTLQEILSKSNSEEDFVAKSKTLFTTQPVYLYHSLRKEGMDLDLNPAHFLNVSEAERHQGNWSRRMDEQLVQYCVFLCEEFGLLSPDELPLTTIRVPEDGELAQRFRSIAAVSLPALRLRYLLLKRLNSLLSTTLPLVNMKSTDAIGSLAWQLSEIRSLIFTPVKVKFWTQILDNTSVESEKRPVVTLDRIKIASHKEAKGENSFSLAQDSMFGTALAQLKQVSPLALRPKRPTGAADPFIAFEVVFQGENVVGEGGPYRQFFHDVSSELVRSSSPLFVPCPNNWANVGENRDKLVPKPSNVSDELLEMYEFVGLLIGCSLRTGVRLSLDLPPLFWKKLVGQPVSEADLEVVDQSLCDSLRFIESVEPDLLEDCIFETFTTILSDKTTVELIENGSNIPVTKENRLEYVRLVKQTRLNESERQIRAILNGVAKIVSPQLLHLCSWAELQRLVCGKPDIDVDLLQRHTKYSPGLSPSTHKHLEYFWEALRSFTAEQRRQFIRFAWGQERLPADDAEFDRTQTRLLVKPTVKQYDEPDKVLPKADTCFFNIELPAYSSLEVMKERLLLAISMCASLDADEATDRIDVYFDDPDDEEEE